MATWTQTTTTPAPGNDLTALVANAVQTGVTLAGPQKDETVHYALVPSGMTMESLEEFQWPDGRPQERINGEVRLYDTASFTKYVSAFTDERTRVFAYPKAGSFLAVLDYHVAGDRKPEFLKHKAHLTLEQDQRWVIWSKNDNEWFSQTDFAEFIEDNLLDIDTPPAAAMLEVARDLHAKNDVSFDSKVSLKDGQIQMTYQETLKAGVGQGNLEVPEKFTIRIPVFYGEAPVVLDMRLRFRIRDQKVVFCYRMYRKQETLQRAFLAASAGIGEALKADVLMGTPV